MNITEGVLVKEHPHWIQSLRFYFISALAFILPVFFPKFWPAVGVGVLIILIAEVVRLSETYYVLETGVAWQYRLLSTSRKFAEYEKLQNLEVSQSFFENLLGIGSIKFDTAGVDRIEVSFHLVKSPYKIEKIVREKMALK